MTRHYDMDEEEAKFAVCEVCDSDILIDYYSEIGDSITCDDCGAYYILQSHSPLRITLMEDEDDESYKALDFDD